MMWEDASFSSVWQVIAAWILVIYWFFAPVPILSIRLGHPRCARITEYFRETVAGPVLLILVIVGWAMGVNPETGEILSNYMFLLILSLFCSAVWGADTIRWWYWRAEERRQQVEIRAQVESFVLSSAGSVCPVCLETLELSDHMWRISTCTHRFHAACLGRWLGSSATCPVCRHPVLP